MTRQAGRGGYILLALAVTGCIIQSASSFALTYSRPEPDPWFSVSIQVEAKSLPPGVEFKRITFPDNEFAYFSNSSATPLYLVATPSTPPDWVRDLPANVIPRRMAVSGAAFRMHSWHDWSRENFPGILVEGHLTISQGQAAGIFAMDAYLGTEKIAIRGRFFRDRVNRLELDSPLPSPLRLTEVRGQRGRFVIANDGPVPLYTGTAFAKPVGWVTEVPFGFLATHKLLAGKSYFAETFMPSSADGWREVEPHDSRLTEREFEWYVPSFRFKQIYQDNRPGDAQVPEPQPFEMTAFYGARKITLRGRVLYDLNPHYDPLASRGPSICMSCTGSMCDECAKHQRPARGTDNAPKHPPTY